MAKNQTVVKATSITWPISYINVMSGWITTKDGTNLCEEDAAAQGIRTWDEGITSHSTSDQFKDKCPQDHVIICSVCHKLLTGLKPNPFAIPDPPKVEDIKTGLCMTRAIDSAFHNACIHIARQKSIDAGIENFYDDTPEASAIRNNICPSFYKASNNHLTLTWETIAVVNDIIARYTLMDACDKSEATALKRLTKQITEAIQEALRSMKGTRDEAIARARRVSITTEPAVWTIVPVEDTSRNRGLLYVKAFDTAPQREGEDEWSYNYRTDANDKGRGEHRQEIKAYVDVREGTALVTFEQSAPVDMVNFKSGWEDVTDDSIEEAVARATTIVQARCDYSDARDAEHAVYAQEALITAGLEVA
jgi:hypothetical protein